MPFFDFFILTAVFGIFAESNIFLGEAFFYLLCRKDKRAFGFVVYFLESGAGNNNGEFQAFRSMNSH
jgi:hypothetical protein